MTKNKETKHYVHPEYKRQTEKNLPQITKQTKPWFGTPFTTFATKWRQPISYNPGAHIKSCLGHLYPVG